MTKEQRFIELIKLAEANGFESQLIEDLNYQQFRIVDHLIFVGGYSSYTQSLNDLVLNTDFFDCLFKGHITHSDLEFEIYESYVTSKETLFVDKVSTLRKFQWVLEKDNALEWLLQQFNL